MERTWYLGHTWYMIKSINSSSNQVNHLRCMLLTLSTLKSSRFHFVKFLCILHVQNYLIVRKNMLEQCCVIYFSFFSMLQFIGHICKLITYWSSRFWFKFLCFFILCKSISPLLQIDWSQFVLNFALSIFM